MQKPDLLEYERYEAVYRNILAACKEQRGRPGGMPTPRMALWMCSAKSS